MTNQLLAGVNETKKLTWRVFVYVTGDVWTDCFIHNISLDLLLFLYFHFTPSYEQHMAAISLSGWNHSYSSVYTAWIVSAWVQSDKYLTSFLWGGCELSHCKAARRGKPLQGGGIFIIILGQKIINRILRSLKTRWSLPLSIKHTDLFLAPMIDYDIALWL